MTLSWDEMFEVWLLFFIELRVMSWEMRLIGKSIN